jgi:hypothetical protein|tara:strand:+ start:6081 stop:6410 length:330 start_codon:yes stop_codon:yes gene_type:complete
VSVVVKFTKKRLPKEVVAHWPEIFSDLHVESIPVEYLLSIKVTFKDGKNWEIRLKNNRQKMTNKELEKQITELFKTYGDAIKNVDFRLDTNKVKADITKRTKTFLKKRK